MLLQRWEAKIRRKEKSPQPGIELATTRSWVRHAHHWATRAYSVWECETYWMNNINCMMFNADFNIFQFYRGGQCTYPCFPGFLFISTPYNILSMLLTALPHNHCRRMVNTERRMNLAVVTMISPRTERWPSRGSSQRPPVLKSCALPTELLRLGEWKLNAPL